MPRISLLVLLLALPALAGCGGSEKPKAPPPEAHVRAAAKTFLVTDSVAAQCTTYVTARLVKEAYGGLKACEREAKESSKDYRGRPSATTVTLHGPRATVAVSVAGGTSDGLRGHLDMVREGARWKVDGLPDDFLRSMFSTAVRNVKEGAIATPELRTCMTRQVAALDAPTVRKTLYRMFRGGYGARRATLKIASSCPDGLAAYATGVLVPLLKEQGASKAMLRCAEKKLPPLLKATNLPAIVLGTKDEKSAAPALAGLLIGVQRVCATQRER